MIERALIVRKPWVDLILSGEKVWEMRSMATHIRGRIGIIEQGSGRVVGEVDLVDCFSNLSLQQLVEHTDKHRILDQRFLVQWPIAWKLASPERYLRPLAYRHPSGAVVWVKVSI